MIFVIDFIGISLKEKIIAITDDYFNPILICQKGCIVSKPFDHLPSLAYHNIMSTFSHDLKSHCIKLSVDRTETSAIKLRKYPLLKEIAAVVDRLIIEVAKILHRIQESFVFTGSDHDSLLCE